MVLITESFNTILLCCYRLSGCSEKVKRESQMCSFFHCKVVGFELLNLKVQLEGISLEVSNG